MWTHKTKYKGQEFLGNYEFSKKTKKRIFKLKNAKTGKEIPTEFAAPVKAKQAGFVKAA